MTSLFESLTRKPTVTLRDDDHVTISFTIPAELLHDFSKLFDSLTGFIRIIEKEKRLARSKSLSESSKHSEQLKQAKEIHYARIIKLYDEYLHQGLNRNAAIKQISVTLRKEKHPWSSTDSVRFSLIDAGRPGRVGKPRRSNS